MPTIEFSNYPHILPSRKNIIERLLFLTDYNEQLVVVIGDSGVGKTTVLEYFLELGYPDANKVYVKANAATSPNVIKQRICEQLIGNQLIDENDSLSSTLADYPALHNGKVIIVIDDAEYLTEDFYQQLTQLVAMNQTHDTEVAVVLSADVNNDNVSKERVDGLKQHGVFLELSNLNSAEARELITIYTADSAWLKQKENIEQLKLTDGNPQQIIKLVNQPAAEQPLGVKSNMMPWIASGIFVCGIAAWLWLSDFSLVNSIKSEEATYEDAVALSQQSSSKTSEHIDKQHQSSIKQSSNEERVLSQLAIPVETIAPSSDATTNKTDELALDLSWQQLEQDNIKDIATSKAVASASLTTNAIQEQGIDQVPIYASDADNASVENAVKSTVKSVDESVDENLANINRPSESQVSTHENNNRTEINQIESQAEIITNEAMQAIESGTYQYHNREVHKLNPSSYTLQLTGVSSEQTLAQFLRYHQLENTAMVYTTQRNNKPWYVVIYQVYNSAEQARIAINKLPQQLQAIQPWPKSIAAIHQELAANQTEQNE